MWPEIAVCIPTFNRAQIVKRTVELLRTNLHYSGHVVILVGCDGDDDTPDALASVGDRDTGALVLSQRAGGVGANMNRLLRAAQVLRAAQAQRIELFITMDDDHHLIAPLCLDRHVTKLMNDQSAGRIHLLMEAKGDEHYDNYKFVGTLDSDHYWRVHWDSPEHFIMSFRPNITHWRWWEVMGYLPEGLRTGQTEYQYAAHCRMVGQSSVQHGSGGVNVFVPLTAPGRETWAHVNNGVSWNRMGL